MTTNYRRGYELERKVKKILEKEGYFVVRSAGSHSPADLVAIRGSETDLNGVVWPDVMLVQCKKGRAPFKEIVNLKRLVHVLGVDGMIWDKDGRRDVLDIMT